MFVTHNDSNLNISLAFDQITHRMRVRDDYGEFIPFPIAMWKECVDRPFYTHFQRIGKPYVYVVEIFIGEYRHRYICNN